MLFTNRALADVERAIGKSVTALLKGMVQSGEVPDVSVGDTAYLLQVGMEHARRDRQSRPQPYTLDDAFAVLDLAGYAKVVNVVMAALMATFSYIGEPEETPGPPA